VNRVDIQSYEKAYPPVPNGCLLDDALLPPPAWLADAWQRSARVSN
jgi:hypothetical protein